MIAVHTVFIAKENIRFIEEWIDYHIHIGFDKFYLYDNSNVQKVNYFDSVISPKKHMIPGKVNKYGVNFDSLVKLSESEIVEIMDKIQKKYQNIVNFIEWSPKDKDGFVCYDQVEAHNDCLKKLKNDNIEWCASIDIDEFIIINKKFDSNIKKYIQSLASPMSSINMGQVRYDSRFNNMDKLVITIPMTLSVPLPRNHSNKYIYRIRDVIKLEVHSCKTMGYEVSPSIDEISFNHYNSNTHDLTIKDNPISVDIINTIKENSKHYIYKSY